MCCQNGMALGRPMQASTQAPCQRIVCSREMPHPKYLCALPLCLDSTALSAPRPKHFRTGFRRWTRSRRNQQRTGGFLGPVAGSTGELGSQQGTGSFLDSEALRHTLFAHRQHAVYHPPLFIIGEAGVRHEAFPFPRSHADVYERMMGPIYT